METQESICNNCGIVVSYAGKPKLWHCGDCGYDTDDRDEMQG